MALSDVGDREISLTLLVNSKGQVELRNFNEQLKKLEDTSKAAERAVDKLANETDRFSSSMVGAFTKAQLLVGFLKTGFSIAINTVLGPLQKIVDLIAALTKQVTKATEDFETFTITLEGAIKSSTRARELTNFIQEFGLKSPQRVQDIQELVKSLALIPSLAPTFFGDFEKVKLNLEDLFNTVIALGSLDPQQGIPGAIFAIREALGGQFRTLQGRFEILPSIVAGSIGATVDELKRSPQKVIQALKAFTDQVVGADTIAKLGGRPSVKIGNIEESLTQFFPRLIGQAGAFNFIGDFLNDVDAALQKFFKSGGDFETKFAGRFSTTLQRILASTIQIARVGLGSALSAVLGTDESETQVSSIAEALLKPFEAIAEFMVRFANVVTQNRDLLTNFFGALFEGIKGLFSSVFGFIEELPKLAPALGLVAEGFTKMLSISTTIVTRVATAVDEILLPIFKGPLGSLVFGEAAAKGVADIEARQEQRANLSGLRKQAASGAGIVPFSNILDPSRAQLDVTSPFFFPLLASQLSGQIAGPGRGQGSFPGVRQLTSGSVQELLGDQEFLANLILGPGRRRPTSSFNLGGGRSFDGLSSAGTALFQALQGSPDTNPVQEDLFGRRIFTSRKQTPIEIFGTSVNELPGFLRRSLGGTAETLRTKGLQADEKLTKELLTQEERAANDIFEIVDLAAQSTQNLQLVAADTIKNLRRGAGEAIDEVSGSSATAAEKLAAINSINEKLRESIQRVGSEVNRVQGVIAQSTTGAAKGSVIDLLLGATKDQDLERLDEFTRLTEIVGQNIAKITPSFAGQRAESAFGKLTGAAQKSILDNILRGNLVPFSAAKFLASGNEAEKAAAAIKFLGDKASPEDIQGLREGAKLFGDANLEKLAGAAVNRRGFLAGRSAADITRFDKSPQSELSALREQLTILGQQEDIESRILDLIRRTSSEYIGINLSERETAKLQDFIQKAAGLRTRELKEQLRLKEIETVLVREENEFNRQLGLAGDVGERLRLTGERIKEVANVIDDVNSSRSAGLLTTLVGGTELNFKSPAEMLSFVTSLNEKLLELRNNAEQERRAIVPGTTGATFDEFVAFGARSRGTGISNVLDELGGTNSAKVALTRGFADQFGLLKRTRDSSGKEVVDFKEVSDFFQEGMVQVGLSTAEGFRQGIGDSIYGAFTGQFESIQQAWQTFLDGLLRAFSDFISDMIVKSLFGKLFGAIAGGVTGGGVTNILTGDGAGAGPAIDPFFVSQGLARGGVFDGSFVPFRAFSSGGIARSPTLGLVAEAGYPEAVVPMLDGRSIPVSFRMPQNIGNLNQAPIYVVNVLNPAEVTRMGLPANARIIHNEVVGDLRNHGSIHRAMTKHSRG